MSMVLYGAESWTCTTSNEYPRLNTFHNNNLRKLVRMKRLEIKNERLHKLTNTFPMENYVRKYRLRWAGHVRRMEPDRIPKKVLFGELTEGRARVGRPRKNWMSCLEDDWEKVWKLKKEPNPAFSKWTLMAEQRSNWQKFISYLTPEKEK